MASTPAVNYTISGRLSAWASRSVAAFLAVCVICVGTVVSDVGSPAGAIGNGRFAIAPESSTSFGRTVFTPVLSAGVASSDKVVVVNETAWPLKLHLYAADAYTSRTGGFAIQPEYKPRKLMGMWIRLPVSTVTVAPKSGDVVPFSYRLPANVAPGDYVGGIVAAEEQGQTAQKKGTVRVRVIKAVGVAVYGRVRGRLTPRLAVTGVSIATHDFFGSEFGGSVEATVTYSVTNTGNENLKPTVTVGVSPLLGSRRSLRVHLPQVLPGSTVTFSHTFRSITPLGNLTATVKATGLGAMASGSASRVVVPWGIVAVVVLLGALYIYRHRHRRRRRQRSHRAEPGVRS